MVERRIRNSDTKNWAGLYIQQLEKRKGNDKKVTIRWVEVWQHYLNMRKWRCVHVGTPHCPEGPYGQPVVIPNNDSENVGNVVAETSTKMRGVVKNM